MTEKTVISFVNVRVTRSQSEFHIQVGIGGMSGEEQAN